MSKRLRHAGGVSAVAAGVLVAVVAVILGGGMADAQEGLPIQVAPSSGEPGTVITVSGEGCVGTEVALTLQNGGPIASGSATPNEAGAWSGTIEVPAGVSAGTLTVLAQCFGGGEVVYSPGSFTVTEPTTTTSSTTTTTTTTPSSTTSTTAPSTPGPGRAGPPSAEAPAAPPAQAGLEVALMPPATPVVAEPVLTG